MTHQAIAGGLATKRALQNEQDIIFDMEKNEVGIAPAGCKHPNNSRCTSVIMQRTHN